MRGVVTWLGGIACLAAVAFTTTHAQQITFSARATTVRVDALVTENGRPVPGLKASDFEVLDNGVAQHIDLLGIGNLPLDVVIALDMSESLEGERRDHLDRASRALVDALEPDDRSGLLTFSHQVAVRSALSSDRDGVRRGLDRLRIGSGATSLIDAAYTGLLMPAPDAVRPMLIIFSDGLDTSSFLDADAGIDTAKATNVVVYAVAAGPDYATPPFLRDLTSITGGRLLQVENTSNLKAAFLDMLDEFRQRYLLGFTPKGVAASGYHKLEVRVKRRNSKVTARQGYQAGT